MRPRLSNVQPISVDPAVVEAARRRHTTALRRYARELRAGDDAGTDRLLAATWAELAAQPEFETEERLAEWLYADLRRRALVGGRGGGLADDHTAADDRSAEAIFARLTPKQQEVLHLKFAAGFRHEQIARILELAPAPAAQLLHVALARLAPAFRRAQLMTAPHGRADDARLTLVALGELDGEAWRAGASAPTDAAALDERLEEVRRAARWVTNHLTSHRRHARSKRSSRRTRAVLFVAVAIVLAAGAWLMRRNVADGPAHPEIALSAAAPTRTGSVAVQTRAQENPPETASAASVPVPSEAASLGVFRRAAALTPEPSPVVASENSSGSREPVAERRGGPLGALATAAEPAATPRGQESPGGTADAARAVLFGAPPASQADVAMPPDAADLAPILALKRALGEGRWPRPDEVDAARLAAYFQRGALRGQRALLFTHRFEMATAPWDPQRVLVHVVARAPDAPPAVRAPANVILLLDVSGSMDAPNRLPLVQEAVRGLLDRLRPDDRVGLVTYAGESQVLHAPTPLVEAARLREVLGRQEARGRTNGGAGLAQAFALARSERGVAGEQRVILCTDGEFNMGATGPEELAALVRAAADDGVRLGIFGFGRSGAIDARLERLAALGGGGSGYVNTRADAVRVLLGQLGELVSPVATAVRLTLARDERVEAVAQSHNLLPAEAVAALVEVAPGEAVQATLEYRLAASGEPRFETATARAREREFAAASAELRFAAAVHRFAGLLAGPPERAAPELEALAGWAGDAVDEAGGYRAEFLAFVAQARTVARAAVE